MPAQCSQAQRSVCSGSDSSAERCRRPLPHSSAMLIPPPRRLPSPDGVILEPQAADQGGVEEVAAVEDQRLLEQRPHLLEVRALELAPLGDDQQRIGIAQRVRLVAGEAQPRQVPTPAALRSSPPGRTPGSPRRGAAVRARSPDSALRQVATSDLTVVG
jgi:hypothetical protein